MEDQQYAQLAQYVRQSYQSGASVEAIRAELVQRGWREDLIAPLLAQCKPMKPADPHRVRKGVLWIIGPFVALIIVVLLQLTIRAISAKSADMGVISIFRIVINIFSLIVGMIAVPMMIIGPIVGIVKLTKK